LLFDSFGQLSFEPLIVGLGIFGATIDKKEIRVIFPFEDNFPSFTFNIFCLGGGECS
jgi:hypothetical protein